MSDESKNGVLLEASHVTKTFGGLVAVNDVSFTVPRAGIVSIIGPNGAGKTTFFNMLTGLYKPTIGHVSFEGRNITGKPPHVITKAGIFGVILIVVMLFRPEGLLPSARVKAELHEGVHDEPLYDHEIAGA